MSVTSLLRWAGLRVADGMSKHLSESCETDLYWRADQDCHVDQQIQKYKEDLAKAEFDNMLGLTRTNMIERHLPNLNMGKILDRETFSSSQALGDVAKKTGNS